MTCILERNQCFFFLFPAGTSILGVLLCTAVPIVVVVVVVVVQRLI